MQLAIKVTKNIKIITENSKAWIEAAEGRKNCAGRVAVTTRADFESTKPCSWLLLSSAAL